MKQSKCYTCDKVTHNLLTANCSHKICFNCVKNNRNTHKCSYCTAMSASKHKLISGLSPARREILEKQRERTTNTKSIQSKRYGQSSPHMQRSSRRSQVHAQSCSNYVQRSTSQDPRHQIKLLCKQHHEPLTLFSKTSKQAMCSICLCSKPKYNQDIMPIKGAETYLKKQNHIQREESRVILNDIQKCQKTMRINYQQFQMYYGSHVKVIGQIFSQLHMELQQKQRQLKLQIDNLFMRKLKQCQQIHQDLTYLIQTLQTYRQQNKDTNTLSESLYVYSSFKVIKQTMKTLNLDYISYANKNINLLQYNKGLYSNALSGLIKFSEQLPLKHQEVISLSRRRNRSASSRQKISAKKDVGNSYSNRKKGNSDYDHVLSQKIGLKSPIVEYRDVLTYPNEDRSGGKSNYFNNSTNKTQHNNSLQSYINQNLPKQHQKHSNSTSSYFNKSNSRVTQKQPILSSSNAFDYQLKTPIKNLLNGNDNSSNKNVISPSPSVQQNNPILTNIQDRSHDKNSRNNVQLNVVSTSSIAQGLNMNEEEKSLYKRLLKSRFNKNTRNQHQHQNHQANLYQQRQLLMEEELKIEENRQSHDDQS